MFILNYNNEFKKSIWLPMAANWHFTRVTYEPLSPCHHLLYSGRQEVEQLRRDFLIGNIASVHLIEFVFFLSISRLLFRWVKVELIELKKIFYRSFLSARRKRNGPSHQERGVAVPSIGEIDCRIGPNYTHPAATATKRPRVPSPLSGLEKGGARRNVRTTIVTI